MSLHPVFVLINQELAYILIIEYNFKVKEYLMNRHREIARKWAREKYLKDKDFREKQKEKARKYRRENKEKIKKYNHKKYLERKNKISTN